MNSLFLKSRIKELYPEVEFDVLTPPDEELGDYSINLPFIVAKADKKNPVEAGREILVKLSDDEGLNKYFSKIEFAPPGFINFYLSDEFLRNGLLEINKSKDYGHNKMFAGKKVVVEFTDPNPFKLFHIGHLMSNTIGESIARVYEASGAKVIRVNYQGDVGLHVAKTIWAVLNVSKDAFPKDDEVLAEKIKYLGSAYAAGAGAYEEKSDFKTQIEDINKKIYDRSDEEVNKIYDLGKKWSLEYFETIYKRLGTKFENYFFESETAKDGLKIINENKKIFTESDGALIFKGEDYGLHSRVFINSQGLPTYEAKELGLNKKKFELYNPELSIVITGNEINDYFKVLLKVMELTMPEVAQKTRHIGHGMMRFASGKMSSRTGNVITADSLIGELLSKIVTREGMVPEDSEAIAIGALKYSILKQSIGQDIIFDFDRALSVKGDSAPYIQYALVRLKSIFEKSENERGVDGKKLSLLNQPEELLLLRKMSKLPEIIEETAEDHQINRIALYTYELASSFHNFYEKHRIVQENKNLEEARLELCRAVEATLKLCLNILGFSAPKKM